jgi:hypothetical protein
MVKAGDLKKRHFLFMTLHCGWRKVRSSVKEDRIRHPFTKQYYISQRQVHSLIV